MKQLDGEDSPSSAAVGGKVAQKHPAVNITNLYADKQTLLMLTGAGDRLRVTVKDAEKVGTERAMESRRSHAAWLMKGQRCSKQFMDQSDV